MNFRYQAFVIGALSVAIHLVNGDPMSSTSMASTSQAAATNTEIFPDRAAVTTEVVATPTPTVAPSPSTPAATTSVVAPKTDENKRTFKRKTKNSKQDYTIVVEQRRRDRDELEVLMASDKNESEFETTIKVIDGAGVCTNGACTLKEEKVESTLADIFNHDTFKELVASADEIVEKAVAERKEQAEKEKEKAEACEIDNTKKQIECLSKKLATAKRDEKIELQAKLYEILQDGLSSHGKEEETLGFIKSNKELLKHLDRFQVESVTTLAADYLAGKSAFKLATQLKEFSKNFEERTLPAYVRALNSNNPTLAFQQMQKASQNLERIVGNDRGYREFQSQFNSVFGSVRSHVSSNVRSSYDSVNQMNAPIVNYYRTAFRDPRMLDQDRLASLEYMEDIYDRGAATAGIASLSTMFRNASSIESEESLSSLLVGRGARRNDNLHFGSREQMYRPIGDNREFQAYVDQLRASVDMGNRGLPSDLGNRGLSTNMLNSYQQPVSSYQSNQVPTAQSAPLTGRGGRSRPTGA